MLKCSTGVIKPPAPDGSRYKFQEKRTGLKTGHYNRKSVGYFVTDYWADVESLLRNTRDRKSASKLLRMQEPGRGFATLLV